MKGINADLRLKGWTELELGREELGEVATGNIPGKENGFRTSE